MYTIAMGKNCNYCKCPPSQIQYPSKKHSKEWREKGKLIYNGIDRINNKVGYVLKNCVSCCKNCNRAKSDLSIENFNNWIKNLSINYGNKL